MHEVTVPAAQATQSVSVIGLGLELIGITFGLFSVITILSTLSKVGGQVGVAFTLTLLGVIFQMGALGYNVVIRELKLLAEPIITTPLGILHSHNIHEALMIVGIIFFMLAARQFAKLSQ